MQPGFEQSYNLFNPQQAGIPLRDLGGGPAGGWRPFMDNKPYNPGAFSAAPISAESLIAEDENWQMGKIVDDSSLRCLFPGPQQRPGLSLSLFNNKPAEASPSFGFHAQPFAQERNFFSLRNSKYLEPVQELLKEICSLGEGKNGGEQRRKEGASSSSSSTQRIQTNSSADVAELKSRYTQLASMLEELDRRYRRYCEQMRSVVSGFELAAGEGAAKVYSALAMNAMSRHFRCLRDAIVEQMKEINKAKGEKDNGAAAGSRGETPRLRLLDHQLRQQKFFQQSGAMEHHPWRPQRGLPERAVSVLRAWLFEHFLHPYPSDVDKHILSRQTGLSRSQVCNWFINARVRLWKPMVEEMYLEETKEKLETQSSRENMLQGDSNPLAHTQNPNSLSIQRLQLQEDQTSRPPQLGSDEDSLSSVVNSSHNQIQHLPRPDHNFGLLGVDYSSYTDCSNQQGFNSGVSLTLGLQQHTGGVSLCFSPGAQNSLFFSKETQFSILEGDTQNPPYKNLMGDPQILQEFQG